MPSTEDIVPLSRGHVHMCASSAVDKMAVLKATQNRSIVRFASQQFAVGHRQTNFAKWFQTEDWYTVDFKPQFEPWFIIDRLSGPLYDVNFRGYGRNKQQQVRAF